MLLLKTAQYRLPDPVADNRISLGELLRSAARRWPGRLALRGDREQSSHRSDLTYAELLLQSEACAQCMLETFVPGERVALWSGNRTEWVILQFGAALAGLILVPLNPAFKAEEARFILKQSRAAGCFAAAEYRGSRLHDLVRKLAPDLPALRYFQEIGEYMDSCGVPARAAAPLPLVLADSPAMIQYTSGTTGFPRGAVLLHGRLTFNAEQVMTRAQVPENGTWLLPMPLFHAGGCVLGVLGAMSRGITLVLMSSWTAEDAVALIHKHQVDLISAVPTMLVGLLESWADSKPNLSSLRRVIAGASTVPADLVRAVEHAFSAEVHIVFGQTECGPVATMTQPNDTAEDKQNTVGKALPGFEVRIADPATGATLGVEKLGEFCARGNTMLEYFDDATATEAAFDADGWLHTGDLCSMDERGYLKVEGRLKDMIVRGGENIYPREIEERLAAEPSIREVAVLGLPDPKWGEVVAAFVVPTTQEKINFSEIAERLGVHVARFKVPQYWFTVDVLPRTATGKVRKFMLLEQWKRTQGPSPSLPAASL